MTKDFKKAVFTLCGGIFIVILGIFLLYLHSRTNMLDFPFQCLRRGDFYPIDSRNIYILVPFCIIFAGFLIELLGFFRLSKAVNNMQIFYNRLNLYFVVTLFVLISIKSIMAESETLFLVKICVSHINDDSALSFFSYFVKGATTSFLLTLSIYFLLKDFIYLKRVFKTTLPIITLVVCILCLFIFFSNDILPYMSYEIHRFLESLMSIKVFIPYLIISFIMYMKILKCEVADEAKEFSLYNFIINKKKIFLILFVVLCVVALLSWVLKGSKLSNMLFAVPLTALLFLPMLLFYRSLFYRKFKVWLIMIGAIVGLILISAVFNYNFYSPPYLLVAIGSIPTILVIFYLLIAPISLSVCIVLKLQQLNFMKTSIALIIAGCILFGYLVFPY